MLIPFAPWRPDKIAIGDHATVAKGVVPLTEDSYGPFKAHATIAGTILVNKPVAEIADTSNGTSYALPAFTPTRRNLLVVGVVVSGSQSVGAISGGGLTWTREVSQSWASAGRMVYLFTARVGASPSSTTITFDCSDDDATGCIMVAWEVQNAKNAGTIVQTAANFGLSTNPSVTFASARAAASTTILMLGHNSTPPSPTYPAGWIETANTSYASPSTGAAAAYRNPGDTGTTIALTQGDTIAWGLIAIEIAAAPSDLSDRCQGAAAFLDSSGTAHVFAGDATKLYKLSAGAWNNVRSVGYTIAAEDSWRFVHHAVENVDRVIAFGDVNTDPQRYRIGTDTDFADLAAGTCPRARHGALMHPGVLMLGNTWDATDGYRQNRVWWHDLVNNDPSSWPTPGSAAAQAVMSDYRDLTIGGPIMGLLGPLGGGAAGLVISRKALHRVQYAGIPSVYDFFPIAHELGSPCPNSAIVVRDIGYFVSDDGFYASDGSAVWPIGDLQVDRFFWGSVDQGYLNRVQAAGDPLGKIVYWAWPDSNASSGNPNRLIAYNVTLKRWSLPLDDTDFEFIFRGYTAGYTLEQLDAFGTIDTLAYPLDSTFWQGGRPALAAFNTSHVYGLHTGANIAAVLETADFVLPERRRYFVKGVAPYIDGAAGQVTAAIGWRDKPSDSPTYTTATAMMADGVCPQRIDARLARARVTIAAGQTWSHAHGIEPLIKATGKR